MLKNKDVNAYKEELYEIQNGKCVLCKNDLDKDIYKNHLDHDHALHGTNAGRCRGLLCILCNPLEGIIKHKFERSGLVSRGVNYVEWLENMLDYIKKDSSGNKIHPNFIGDKVKEFSRKDKNSMINELQDLGLVGIMGTKAELVKTYRRTIRNLYK